MSSNVVMAAFVAEVVHRSGSPPERMSARLATIDAMDDERQPWWTVTAVFDPDGTGSDFGYTEGLAGAGLPELHIWARPSLGEDPGHDWKFSGRDTCRILNRLAWRLIDGRLAVGDTWTETYDEGLVEARFVVHEPVPASEVDAFGAGDGPVLPIKWELCRPPTGRPRPMTAAAQAEAEAAYDRIGPPGTLPPAPLGWELPTTASWAAEQAFGPRTPLVLARAASLWGATVDDWIAIAGNVLAAHQKLPLGYAFSVCATAAREPGRAGAVERVEVAARELMNGFGTVWGAPHFAAVRAWFREGLESDPDIERAWEHMREELAYAVTCHLVVESVADLLPTRVGRLGQGVVLTGLTPPGLAPDARWLCSRAVDRALRDLVRRTPLPDLIDAAAAWDQTFWGDAGQPLVVASFSGAGHSRPAHELLGIAACVAADEALRSRGLGLGTLQVWLTSLATVLSDRAALDPEIVDLFLESAPGVDGLAQLVNSPLTTDAA